jgi:flagellar assembly factor FliW
VEQGYIALGVVSPRRFVPDYQLRVDARDLQSLELTSHGDAEVAVIASRNEVGLTLNLRAPLVIDVAHRRGCQVVAKDAHPIQFPLQTAINTWKKTA